MRSNFWIICGGERFGVFYQTLGQYCEKFADICDIDQRFPGYQYSLTATLDSSIFEVFQEYIRRLSERGEEPANLITMENCEGLQILAEELECQF